MKTIESSFTDVLLNPAIITPHNVKKLLILYDEKVLFIGDSCIRFDMLSLFRSFFPKAEIDINWRETNYSSVYASLLKNNPFLNKTTNLDWEAIDFLEYDAVLCITYEERHLLEILVEKYNQLYTPEHWRTHIYSMSRIGLNLTSRTVTPVFSEPKELSTSALQYKRHPQLFISQKEKTWGTTWLKENGLNNNEKLFIVLDSCSSQKKLLTMEVFSEILTHLLTIDGAKILIFDEKGVGKETFYSSLVGKANISKFIFAKSLGLREALCIISSDQTKLVFGPCTGLLHCASGIYNNFKSMGISEAPLMITYTGKYEREGDNASIWWDTSPLVNCLILRKTSTGKEIVLLHDLKEQEKIDSTNLLSCKEYDSELIINFLSDKL